MNAIPEEVFFSLLIYIPFWFLATQHTERHRNLALSHEQHELTANKLDLHSRDEDGIPTHIYHLKWSRHTGQNYHKL